FRVDSPSSIISSSSPEHEFGYTEKDDFPLLRPIAPALSEEDRCSPSVPLIEPVPVRMSSVKPEIKQKGNKFYERDLDIQEKKTASMLQEKENLSKHMQSLSSSLAQPFKDSNLNQDISVTLTLSASAADDIGGVLSQIAELLKIAVPPTYEVSRSPSPEMLKTSMKHKEEAVNIHSLIQAKPKFCRYCEVVILDSGVKKKKSEMPFLIKEDQFAFKEIEDEETFFCSHKCFMQFAMIYQAVNPPSKPDEEPPTIEVKPHLAISTSTPSEMLSPHSGSPTPATAESNTHSTPSTPTAQVARLVTSPLRHKLDERKALKHRRPGGFGPEFPLRPLIKKWKDKRYKTWTQDFSDDIGIIPETPETEIEVLWKALGTIIIPDPLPEDKRICAFCTKKGDGNTNGPARLLNMDVDKWAHLNCALWSSEVYETLNGDLMNVDVAFTRGTTLECVVCRCVGATLSCFNVRCSKMFHLGCAQKTGCVFFQDKTMMCPTHAPKSEAENVLESLVVFRKVYINRNEDKQVGSIFHGQEEGNYILRIGSLILHSIGQLLPHQIMTGKFHTREFIFPVGYRSSRLYWSMRRLYMRCRYICSILEGDGKPEFCIRVVEKGFEDIIFRDSSPKLVWYKVLEPLEKMRRNADLVKIFPSFVTGEELFGLMEPTIVRVLESLPGTDMLKNYHFKFGRSSLIEMPLTINPTGCARTEPKLRTHFRKPHTLQSSNTSHSLPQTVTGVTGDLNSPYLKQFVHSKSQQYRRLKTEWRNNVYLGRSRIQGLGLFAARDLEKHTMVIEYIGDLIRNEVANRREEIYDEQNRGVYMFRIDSDTVVDATMSGGPARYINHSCDPDCVAEVVPFDKGSKIIIITNRRIPKGEELTYDYKFDFEDEQHKIPCCCGARNCRKWMN
ncbi:hypothetical protein KUTeg_018800, partial [Tegillarca granosa]